MTGLPNELNGNCWANKLLTEITWAMELFDRDLFLIFYNCLKRCQYLFAVLLITDFVLHLSFQCIGICRFFPAFLKRYTGFHKYGISSMLYWEKLNGIVQKVFFEEVSEPQSSS